ncbi:DUF3179 domain-containing protein [Halobaculum sp. EA56]|uniref:DUF3179 domain-containing protein n=1 Tax=Halobaculum sp. EA56 TaxID=3421648 RepID=UPI003EBE8710
METEETEIREVLPRDAIPSIDDPEFGPSYFGEGSDEVIVVDGDPARAYPVRVLSYHEVVNDAVAEVPIAVTWCPICWSALVYDRRVDGEALTFGVSGNLADDSLVLYDRETGSEWQQTSGRCLRGPHEGRTLALRPSAVVTYDRFRDEYPDGVVLQPVRGRGPGESPAAAYDMAPYEGYRERSAFGLHGMRGEGEPREWDRADLDPKTVVLGVEHGGDAVGYPAPAVEAEGGVLADRVGDLAVVVFGDGDRLYAYEDPGVEFERRDGEIRGDGTTWSAATGESADGRRLDPVTTRRLFAFAWQDIHGPEAFYTG